MISAAVIQFILNHWRSLAVAVCVAGAFSAGYYKGHVLGVESTQDKYLADIAKRDRAAAEAMAQALADAQAQASAALNAERQHIEQAQQVDTQFKIIEKTVIKYVERHPETNRCGIDADGLRLWNSANSGRGSAAPSHP